jgi:secondary thiamine-phosphate synthase enzyme
VPRGAVRSTFPAVNPTQETLSIATRGRGFHDVTAEARRIVAASGVTTGLCVLFVQHTSASLVIQENADPSVLRDMERWFAQLAPEDAKRYEHDDEGPDDMPGHLRSSVTRTSETIPIVGGRLALGTWQAIYLFEHRRAAHQRHIVVHVQGI